MSERVGGHEVRGRHEAGCECGLVQCVCVGGRLPVVEADRGPVAYVDGCDLPTSEEAEEIMAEFRWDPYAVEGRPWWRIWR